MFNNFIQQQIKLGITTANSNPCIHCGSFNRYFQLKLIATKRTDIKYIPQIKEICKACNSYIKFASQTPQLMEAINAQLEGVIFYE